MRAPSRVQGTAYLWDGIGFDSVFDDLVACGWLTEDVGAMTLTEAGEVGEAGCVRAGERNVRVHQQT